DAANKRLFECATDNFGIFQRVFFFFQAEDGIRDKLVTGVQTCALPISCLPTRLSNANRWSAYAGCGPAAISSPGKLRLSQWKKQPGREQISCHASSRLWKPALRLAKSLIRFGASSESTKRRW